MIHEAAFEEHAGNTDVADHDEACALDAPVGEAHVAEHGGVKGRGEGDVLGILSMAGVQLQVAVAEIFLIHRRHAARGECEGLDARGATASAFVEVHADEDGIRKPVGKGSAVLERYEDIARAGQAHGVAILLQQALGAEHDIQGSFFFNAALAFCPAVVSPVTRIQDHGADGVGVFNQPWPHDWLYDFCDIHRRNQKPPALLLHREAEDVFHIVNVDFARPGAAANGFRGSAQGEGGAVHQGGSQAVEFGNIFDRHMASSLVHDHLPRAGGNLHGEEQQEQAEDSFHEAWCGGPGVRGVFQVPARGRM